MSDTQRSKIHTRIKLVRGTKKERRRHKARAAAVADLEQKRKRMQRKRLRERRPSHTRMQGLKESTRCSSLNERHRWQRRSVALAPTGAFAADKRAEIKATLESKGAKIGVGDVTKAAGAQWNALKEAIDAAEKRIADGNDLTDEERDTYKNQNDEMAKYVAASEASKKEAAEYNEAKVKEITASHELQLQIADSQQTPLVDFNLASEPVSSTQLVDNELADITFDTAPHDIPRDVWELF